MLPDFVNLYSLWWQYGFVVSISVVTLHWAHFVNKLVCSQPGRLSLAILPCVDAASVSES